MSVGLYRAAVAMIGHERRLDSIASNLANLETVGFKRATTAAHEFLIDRQSGPVRGQSLETRVDFSQGNLRRTGRELDLALFGEGFFAVEGPGGELYTRGGAFQTDTNGVLVTEEGYPVAWKNKSGAIDTTGLPIVVDGEGNVRQGLADLGQLKIVSFEDNAALRQRTGGFWIAPRGLDETTNTATVHQFSLEESNASGVEEIVAMIGVQRAFESTAGLISSIQQSYSRLTRPF